MDALGLRRQTLSWDQISTSDGGHFGCATLLDAAHTGSGHTPSEHTQSEQAPLKSPETEHFESNDASRCCTEEAGRGGPAQEVSKRARTPHPASKAQAAHAALYTGPSYLSSRFECNILTRCLCSAARSQAWRSMGPRLRGVCVLSTVACLAGGVDIAQQPPPFRQRDMPTLRRRIALALYSARGA